MTSVLPAINSGSSLVAIKSDAYGAVTVTRIAMGTSTSSLTYLSWPSTSTVCNLSNASEIHNSTKARTVRLVPISSGKFAEDKSVDSCLHLLRVRRG